MTAKPIKLPAKQTHCEVPARSAALLNCFKADCTFTCSGGNVDHPSAPSLIEAGLIERTGDYPKAYAMTDAGRTFSRRVAMVVSGSNYIHRGNGEETRCDLPGRPAREGITGMECPFCYPA